LRLEASWCRALIADENQITDKEALTNKKIEISPVSTPEAYTMRKMDTCQKTTRAKQQVKLGEPFSETMEMKIAD
jgi:hypothetical protein